MSEPKEIIRKRKHDFILQYYNMAVRDLERHLKIGWETMTTIAGALVLLSTGYQNYLPIPLTVAGAMIILFWGIKNLIDADYWATRAIAFLSNVEAIYFNKSDSKVFNPYIGNHPPLKMMDSLKSQFGAACFLILVTIVFYIYSLDLRIDDYLSFKYKIAQSSICKLLFWVFPILCFLYLLHDAIRTKLKRLKDYLSFVENCPGPGLIASNAEYRDVDLTGNWEEDKFIPGEQIQVNLRNSLNNDIEKWKKYENYSRIIKWASLIVLPIVILIKNCIV